MTISVSHKQCNGNDTFSKIMNALCLFAITMKQDTRFKAKFLSLTTYSKMKPKLSLWTYSILRSKAKSCYRVPIQSVKNNNKEIFAIHTYQRENG